MKPRKAHSYCQIALLILSVGLNRCDAQCAVDWWDVHQRIDGFGASCAGHNSLTPHQADMFFSTNSGIGLSLIRNSIQPDGTTSETSSMQAAQARGAKVWSTPWSPPAAFKDSGTVNGGNFVSNNYQAYANQLASYVAAMKNNYGITLYAVSIQNEPDYSTTAYQSCIWTGDQFHDFIPYLYNALASNGVASTKIMFPEISWWYFDRAEASMNDLTTSNQVSILAAHAYSTSAYAVNNYGKPLWQTEVSTGGAFDGSISNGLYWAQQIHEYLTIAEVNAWHYWWLISANPDNEGLTDTFNNPAKRMYVLGQWSRFVRPDYYRIGANNGTTARVSAFKDPISGNFAIVAINSDTVPLSQSFDLKTIPGVSSVTPWITSSNLSLVAQSSIGVTNWSFTYSLPPRSVVTFVGQSGPQTSLIRYVNLNNTNPAFPYTNWATAATTIQDATDVAAPGDQVLVTNGIYQSGSKSSQAGVSRVVINRAVNVQSVNGPAVTSIDGGGAMRCAFLTNGANLSGFTLVNGSVNDSGAGVSGGSLTNCVLKDNSTVYDGAGAYNCTLNNCVLINNSTQNGSGGGAVNCSLNNCTLANNSAQSGGGAFSSSLNGCRLNNNSASSQGGGTSGCGVTNCTFIGNSASFSGGGSYDSTLQNCAVSGNSAFYGGGTFFSRLNNCTVTANAASYGGGASDSALNNSIIYYNSGGNYYSYTNQTTLNYCCTTPMPTNGTGSITNEPLLDDVAHLTAASPCRGAGNSAYVRGVDIDGQTWTNPPSIGCDEFYPGQLGGLLSVAIDAPYTTVSVGFAADFIGQIVGHATSSYWDFGDGTVVSNKPSLVSRSWSAAGNYAVILRAFDDTHPLGLSATTMVHVVSQAIHFVSQANNHPLAPYVSWATAATNIQDAVDAAGPGEMVLVNDGFYQNGGKVVSGFGGSNRVAITKTVTVQSVNGPARTIIYGGLEMRCVYLVSSASLSGFSLEFGLVDSPYEGGGVYGGTVTNCLLLGNGGIGAGASHSTLRQCTLAGNSTEIISGDPLNGGGAKSCTLFNCILTNNSCYGEGGAAYQCTLNNCLLAGNSANNGAGASGSALNNCTLTTNGPYGSSVYSSTLNGCILSDDGGPDTCTLNNCSLTNEGIVSSTLNNCTVIGGDGAYGSRLRNCFVTGVSDYAALNSTLNNCTVVGNGRGVYSCTNYNCIVYYSTGTYYAGADNYDSDSRFYYCCTTPMPAYGAGNIASEPLLTDLAHISADSPCLHAGNVAYRSGTDIDGQAWANPPSIGCDEYYAGSVTGAVSVAITATYTNIAIGFTVDFAAQLTGRASANAWNFGDGTVVSNHFLHASHSWSSGGDYPVVFRAYNDTYPAGVSATIIIHVVDHPVQYVSINSTNPVVPYTSWATAATNIQDAINAAYFGGTVLVSNGVYTQISVPARLTIQSVNGAAVTTINGNRSQSCAHLPTYGVLSGFTLTNGSSYQGGGANGGMLNYCILSGNQGSYGGGAYSSTLTSCLLTNNSSGYGGGGANSCTLRNCTLVGNQADSVGGGGAYGSTLSDCTLTGNTANAGGGVYNCVLNRCAVTSNSTYYGYAYGAGAYGDTVNQCILNNCLVAGNTGSGATTCTLNNCTLTGNSSYGAGGCNLNNCAVIANQGIGVSDCTLSNCTVTGNSGIGANFSTLYNSILYYNVASNYDSGSAFNYCCTTPLPVNGSNNITSEPLLTDSFHLSATSPCIGAGSAAYARGLDIDREPWANPPSIGCDEFHAGAVSGSLTVAISADYTSAATGVALNFTSQITGRASANFWDFGDGTILSNRPYATHNWAAAGNYVVVFHAYNDDHLAGITATLTISVLEHPVQYVSLSSATPLSPYTSWATAATNIQDAVDVAYLGGTILVSNGVYRTGSQTRTNEQAGSLESNRVVITKPVPVQSVNGANVTIIDGGGVLRCVFLTNGAMLTGFTLTNGYGPTFIVGGAYGGTLNNCILSGNVGGAYLSALNDCTLTANTYGGANYCSLNRCTLIGNSGTAAYASKLNSCAILGNQDDGAWISTLTNCTVLGNSGYGAIQSTLYNCIVYYNSTTNYDSGQYGSALNFCCTTPMPSFDSGSGFGLSNSNNIISEPQLSDSIHLSAGSPCRAAGSLAYTSGLDIDGEAWLNPPSIGCAEFRAGAITGRLSVTVAPNYTEVVVGFLLSFNGTIAGHAASSRWEFGDGTIITNAPFQPYITHAWTNIGDYVVTLRAYNDAYPAGAIGTVTIHVVAQPVHYVTLTNRNPVSPYSSWATAATNIQDALDAATVPGALVLVSNGVYQLGSGFFDGASRVAVTMPLTVQSVNGPGVTVINGSGTARCAYLTNGAALAGFTLTNGYAYTGRGPAVYGGTVTNCILIGNSGGAAYASVLNNCILARNSGSAAISSILNNCTLTNNSAYNGGGADRCTLNNCILRNNSASYYGGGAYGDYNNPSTLNNCVLSQNRASYGGGASYCVLQNCTLTNNSATYGGGAEDCQLSNCILRANTNGGAYESSLTNCLLNANTGYGASISTLSKCFLTTNFGNGASDSSLDNSIISSNRGNGASFCTLYNCTVVGNTNSGALSSTLYNCVVYYNATSNYSADTFLSYCCSTPMPTNAGVGNITNEPLFVNQTAGSLRLQSNSPCINSGLNDYAPLSPDLDGNPRIVGGTVDIGAYEFQSPSSVISYAWLQRYGFPTDGSADHADPDHDGVDNYHEWLAGSDPTDPLSSAPVITVQPLTHRVLLGDNAIFSVTATGTAPLAYQWLYNQTNNIPNATNSLLIITNAQWANAGVYSVLVSNLYGSLLSSNAILTLDQAPMADASASKLLYISPNGIDATVLLNGSRSSDLDGDILRYAWFDASQALPLANGVIAIVVLPVGSHSILLLVNDGTVSRTNSIGIAVLTTAQAVERLIREVDAAGERVNPLDASLRAALKSIQKGHSGPAAHQLEAFQHKVQIQVAREDPTLAQIFLHDAQEIIDALEAGDGNANKDHGHGHITSLKHTSKGHAQLQFDGSTASTFIIEASTNLVDWEMIGLGAPLSDGQFQFEDAQAASFPRRFYRVRAQ